MMQNAFWLLIRVAAVVLASGISRPAIAQIAQAGRGETLLRAGDAVRITVWNHDELTGEFAITADGRIAHPIYHQLEVAGLPISNVEIMIQEILRGFATEPQFVIEPLVRVVVGGEVRQPNLYLLPVEMTIAQAVGLAGGVTDQARLDEIVLLRRGDEYSIDLTDATSGGGQLAVQSGDQIIVNRRVSFFREYVAPAGSITAALVSIITLLIRN